MISVALVEDNRLVREGISALLNQVKDFDLVAAAPRLDTAQLRAANPQVVLLDLGLGNGNSAQIAEEVLKEFPNSKVIVMDILPVREDIMEFIALGVSGFIMKDASFDDVVRTIYDVVRGVPITPRMTTETLFSRIASDAVATSGPAAMSAVRMTPREREVIDLIAEGLANDEISQRLSIATYTVRSHVRNIMEKLMLHTRLQIAAYAHKEAVAEAKKETS